MKTVTPLCSAYEERWSTLSIVKKIIMYYDNSAVIRNGSENRINVNFWTPGRADKGPINSVPSVRPSATGISRERFIQFFQNLA